MYKVSETASGGGADGAVGRVDALGTEAGLIGAGCLTSSAGKAVPVTGAGSGSAMTRTS